MPASHESPGDAALHTIGPYTLRPLNLQTDLPAIRTMAGDIWSGSGYALMEARFGVMGDNLWQEWLWPDIEKDLRSDPARCFVAVRDGQVAGFCCYSIDTARKRGIVGYNGVARAHQGHGLGSGMIDFIMKKIKSEDVTHAVVIVQDNDAHAPARRIYEKQGFEKIAGNHFMAMKI